MSLSTCTATSSLPDTPHQLQNSNIPRRAFGKKSIVKRLFQSSWFSKWHWLHYVEDQDMVLCHTCTRAHSDVKLQCSSNVDSGFSNWKYATVKFYIHASTKSHKEAVLKTVTLPSTTANIAYLLSEQHKQEKMDRRQRFLKVLTALNYLAHRGETIILHGCWCC